MNHQKGFANIIVIIIAVVVLAGAVGYFTLVRKTPEVAQQTNTPIPPSNQTTTTPTTTTDTTWLTFSDNSHISFQYPSNWKVGKFEHNPNDYNLQPIDHFTAESKNNNIFISITGYCMNTQCLTVYSLDDMVREFGAKIISTAKAKNVTGYKVKFTDGKTGYLFIKGDDLVTISTDIYLTYMDKIIPSLTMLTTGTTNAPNPTPISHDVKYFYDTTPFPKAGEPLSGYYDKVSIRGRLITYKIPVNCLVAPCPESDIPGFILEDVNNKSYQINIRDTSNLIVKNLQVGGIYVISGTLEHGFDYKNQVVFIFDAEKVD